MKPATPLFFFGLIATASLFAVPATGSFAAEPDRLDEIVVTSRKRPEPLRLHAGNIAAIDNDTLQAVGHQHIQELMTRIAGTWVSRGSGQEHLTAIRSPVLTGAGSCGAFLFLEDGIPARPAGFCNVNQMFELLTEQAERIEVIRGPGNALYGSNALHGIVNVIMPAPGNLRQSAALEYGANDFFRVRAALPLGRQAAHLLSLLYADDGGFRAASGYRQSKLHAKSRLPAFNGELLLGFSGSDLDQETAGFILGQDAYKDAALREANLNPEAYRKADSQRLYAIWSGTLRGVAVDIRPYLRHSGMEFLQHFLPGKPLEENGHTGAGLSMLFNMPRKTATITAGTDLEYGAMFLKQTQNGTTTGSAFLVATRPPGKHYDYDVNTLSVSPFIQSEWQAGERWRLHAGLRLEYLRYNYDNRMLSGNTRDDGTVCGFGGCLYSRPANRNDDFFNAAPKFGLSYEISPALSAYASLARGFRAPQATELYRLQSGQQLADLDSERLDSLEFGLRGSWPALHFDIATYHMQKRDSVLRDADGFNISGGRSRHTGAEAQFDWHPHPQWLLSLDLSYGRHEYDFDLLAARGETFVSGRDIDTAPRWLGNLDIAFTAHEKLQVNLQWSAIGDYYLDAESRFSYPGHRLLNARLNWQATASLEVLLRLNNLAGESYADRADYAFGNYRYFPGRDREAFIELRYTRSESE